MLRDGGTPSLFSEQDRFFAEIGGDRLPGGNRSTQPDARGERAELSHRARESICDFFSDDSRSGLFRHTPLASAEKTQS